MSGFIEQRRLLIAATIPFSYVPTLHPNRPRIIIQKRNEAGVLKGAPCVTDR